jgi:serine O-acetyltransferase
MKSPTMTDSPALTRLEFYADAGPDLEQLAAELVRSAFNPQRDLADAGTVALPLPSRDAVSNLVEALRSVLFPGYFSQSGQFPGGMRIKVNAALERIARELREQVLRGMCFTCQEQACTQACNERAGSITAQFMAQLPRIQQLLAQDALAAYAGDPACISPYEPVLCYPGVLALANQRLAHALYELGVPLVPRMITEQAHSLTGIDIHPGAQIGESFFIDHGTGVVIGETCVIGNRVKLYQGVTLGAKSFPLDAQGMPVKGVARHPIVEDDVTIYSGVTILGRVRIGAGSIIGGNVWLTRSVPPHSRIYQAQAS